MLLNNKQTNKQTNVVHNILVLGFAGRVHSVVDFDLDGMELSGHHLLQTAANIFIYWLWKGCIA